jgi:hypothetical protein
MEKQPMINNKLGGMDYAALAAEGTAYLKQLSKETWNALFYLIEHHLLAPPVALTHETDLFSFQISLLFPNKFYIVKTALTEIISNQIPANIGYSLYMEWVTALPKSISGQV